jgi:two-component system, sensor histidine kinase and response regulator
MKLTTASLTFSLALLLALGGNAWVMLQVKQAHDASVTAQEHQRESVALIDEIRQETQKRTTLVRAYTATGKPSFLLYYYDSIFIRNGDKLPPPGYNPHTYWDQAIAGRVHHDPAKQGAGLSLARRMQLLGFNAEEIEALNNVLSTMEVMTGIEQVAFAATQGL